MNWSVLTSRTQAPLPDGAARSIADGMRKFFTADLIRRIALHRRVTRHSIDRGVEMAFPLLLTALARLASQPRGACRLAVSVRRQYPATLDTIRAGIGSESQDVAGAYGSGYIALLIGGEAFSAICANVARSSWLSDQETRLLVGLVGWVLTSQLRAEQRCRELDPSGLARLLKCSCDDGAHGGHALPGADQWRSSAHLR